MLLIVLALHLIFSALANESVSQKAGVGHGAVPSANSKCRRTYFPFWWPRYTACWKGSCECLRRMPEQKLNSCAAATRALPVSFLEELFWTQLH